jgi:tetratricopeptide (TPR) repeat protein
MGLAQAYVAKLMSIPQGPEQGLWSNKAVQQWQAVLEKDPDHWEARYSLAFNWSMWPDFLNKTPDAIREFEKVREVQERQTPEAKHADTYLQLSRLYVKQGKADKAKDVLRSGLGRFPQDEDLKKALASMED